MYSTKDECPNTQDLGTSARNPSINTCTIKKFSAVSVQYKTAFSHPIANVTCTSWTGKISIISGQIFLLKQYINIYFA